jgi:hypothetical protein
MSRYRFISDPGHGWLEVPVKELTTLGVAHLISSCSYVKGALAYLEEDCDMSVFLTAKFGRDVIARKMACTRFWADDTTQVYQEHTFIRRLPCYPSANGYHYKKAMAYCQPQAVTT